MAGARTIVINRTLRAPPSYVFDSIADPTRLAQLSRGVRTVDLLEQGSPVPHGVGAVRLVDLGPMFLEEQVTGYDRPRRFEYLIRRARPTFTHHGGSLETTPADGGGTRVKWKTAVSVDVPLIGPAATFVTAALLRASLASVLVAVDRRFASGL